MGSCLEAPPCTLVLLTVCRRRSLPWPPPPSRSRSLLLLRGSTPSGSEDPSWLPSPLPADVDLQAGVRRVRPLHRAQEVLLNVIIMSVQTNTHNWQMYPYYYVGGNIFNKYFGVTSVLPSTTEL